jgi:hypothetical protein
VGPQSLLSLFLAHDKTSFALPCSPDIMCHLVTGPKAMGPIDDGLEAPRLHEAKQPLSLCKLIASGAGYRNGLLTNTIIQHGVNP